MTVKTYSYEVKGLAADGQTWTSSGTITCNFHEVQGRVMRRVFADLRSGKAVYSQPGVGCSGPYDILEMTIRQVGR